MLSWKLITSSILVLYNIVLLNLHHVTHTHAPMHAPTNGFLQVPSSRRAPALCTETTAPPSPGSPAARRALRGSRARSETSVPSKPDLLRGDCHSYRVLITLEEAREILGCCHGWWQQPGPGHSTGAAGPSHGYQLVGRCKQRWSGGSDPSEPPQDAALAARPEHMSPLLQSYLLACFLINNLFLSFLTLMFIDV